MKEQVEAAQKALLALKKLQRMAVVTPKQTVVVSTRRLRTPPSATWMTLLSAQKSSKFFDDSEITKGVENGLKFWEADFSREEEKNGHDIVFDSFEERNDDDAPTTFAEKEDPYATLPQEAADEPACLSKIYDDLDVADCPFTLPQVDPYAAEEDALDTPATLDQLYCDAQAHYDTPSFLYVPPQQQQQQITVLKTPNDDDRRKKQQINKDDQEKQLHASLRGPLNLVIVQENDATSRFTVAPPFFDYDDDEYDDEADAPDDLDNKKSFPLACF